MACARRRRSAKRPGEVSHAAVKNLKIVKYTELAVTLLRSFGQAMLQKAERPRHCFSLFRVEGVKNENAEKSEKTWPKHTKKVIAAVPYFSSEHADGDRGGGTGGGKEH